MQPYSGGDRAGFAPASLFSPCRSGAPEAYKELIEAGHYHGNFHSVNLSDFSKPQATDVP